MLREANLVPRNWALPRDRRTTCLYHSCSCHCNLPRFTYSIEYKKTTDGSYTAWITNATLDAGSVDTATTVHQVKNGLDPANYNVRVTYSTLSDSGNNELNYDVGSIWSGSYSSSETHATSYPTTPQYRFYVDDIGGGDVEVQVIWDDTEVYYTATNGCYYNEVPVRHVLSTFRFLVSCYM